ncbi:MAG: ferredoxin, partial [bacterium]|nr:ferredoxin [bacterium]
MARKVYLELSPPSLGDNRGDVDRVLDTLAKREGIEAPCVPLSLMAKISAILYEANFQITVVLSRSSRGWAVMDVESGDTRGAHWGMAVDLGSTNMVFYLVDLSRGILVARRAVENPQVRHGEDILTRIHECQEAEGLRA